MRIGIMGGSFDPIHIGHLMVAEQMREARQLERILFIPSKIPPHKAERELASPRDRIKMARLAVEGHSAFDVSDIELRREGPSYSIDTLAELREKWRDQHRIFFIIGSDTLADLPTWRRPGDLVDQADFLTAVRPGFPIDSWDDLSVTFSPEQVARLKQGCVDTIPIGISSTEIRRRARQGHSIRYLVPEAVEQYIQRRGLYGSRRKPR